MVSRKIVISDPAGLHLRPAKKFCEIAMRYACSVAFDYHDGCACANAKSVLSVLAAGIRGGEEITVRCDGEDEEEALAAFVSEFGTKR
uniref:HPr family phosphocarrier protein n=1 Tax=Eubacterium cellulosolvens TaxID=29322 RepID=UPI000489C1B6|nr:HPr family phosphocarrier protein [[Eubacterium] cellulosolvens]